MWDDNVKVTVKGIHCEYVEWIYLAVSMEISCRFREHDINPTVISSKYERFPLAQE